MANNNNDKNNKTEGILRRIVNGAVEGMRTGLNVEKNRGILETLAKRASSKEGQFYATLADPNAYYDKQGFGSAGTGMRAAQQAYQGSETARAAMKAKGVATPTSQLASATSIHNKLQGELGIGQFVPHPLTGDMVNYNSMDGTLQAFYVKEFQSRLMGMNDEQVDAMLQKQFAKLNKMKRAHDDAVELAKVKDLKGWEARQLKNKELTKKWAKYRKENNLEGTGAIGYGELIFPILKNFAVALRDTDYGKLGTGLLDVAKQGGEKFFKSAQDIYKEAQKETQEGSPNFSTMDNQHINKRWNTGIRRGGN